MSANLLRRTALIVSVVACLFVASPAHAQTKPATPPADAVKTQPAAAAETAIELQAGVQERLRQTVDAIERQQRQLATLHQRRNSLPEGQADAELDKTIDTEQKQLDELRQQFIELATSDYSLLNNDEPQQIDIKWQDEMLQVVYPLLREMKQLSERPRAVEQLSAQVAFYQQRADALDKGLAHLGKVIAQTDDRKLLPSLRKLESSATEAKADVQQKLDTLQRRYQDLRDDSPPLWSSFWNAMREFTTGMGWHLLLGLTLAIATYLLVQLLARLPLRIIEKRHFETYVFVERTVHFLARVVGAFLCALVFLMVLYALNAWVLLGLAVIVLIGVLFGLKNLLPNYLTEIRTMLNLGSVRQGERLLYNGLPWRVADLDVYTLLHNPALGGVLRVPLTQISRLSSRPFHDDEPWFPTRTGDVVQMGDGVQGRIERQTPEVVQLNCGESLLTYRTEKFLEARPQNLSTGFAVTSIFSIDYRHRHEALTAIEPQLLEALQQALQQQEFAAHCLHLNVEFKMASASSLDFRLLALFKGEAAENHARIQRWLQRAALECANRHDWEIPFQQIKIHTEAIHASAPQAAAP